jgi:hypothetical protein
VFRGKFIAGLRRAHHKNRLTCAGSIHHLTEPKYFAAFLRTLFRQDWVVYAKPAFGGPEQVIRYLGRYTHRVAISNHRLVSFDGERVTFRWRDYAGGNKMKTMIVSADDFCFTSCRRDSSASATSALWPITNALNRLRCARGF